MGLPSQKRTNTSKRQRASHFALKKTTTTKCEKCSAKTLPHRACTKCGTYKGRKVVDVTKRVLRTKRNKSKLEK
ncbi:MAG: 50S ribosomal protein L32 [Candidatus Magasanikbacteria bacterium]|nr:50S ribosomal protein L32 [Candidatus Magasanikbacteria bacterium]MBT4315097.1 50S ribosomal protein L32 [Candidatus Magasanikbacteria bacterium]MBT4547007.1 50S ribosomal protein L32 [Candidatus Magasanikbacteria bacterium]MBT6819069.1 50S ribosomal protein L32 [Candidatus Magasanikbacteria bacterium]